MRRDLTSKKLILLNWVTFSPKQLYQVQSMQNLGYEVSLYTIDFLGDSFATAQRLPTQIEVNILSRKPASRVREFFRTLHQAGENAVVLIPAASKISWIAVLVSRIHGFRTITIEWGDIGARNPILLRIAMRLSYWFAHVVWIKEPFMTRFFRKRMRSKLFFLPNAVDSSTIQTKIDPFARDVDFIWVNRFMAGRRRPLWFVEAASELSNQHPVRVFLLGCLPPERTRPEDQQEQILSKQRETSSISVLDFMPPAEYLARSRFFVMIANEVFGNNALLEAMASGVVPIVNSSPGIEMLVEDGVNGFICGNRYRDLVDTMRRALELEMSEWKRMSQAAQATTSTKFAPTLWQDKFEALIDFSRLPWRTRRKDEGVLP